MTSWHFATSSSAIASFRGKAAGVLLSPAQFDALSQRARFVAAIDEGLADPEAGRVHTHAEVVAELKKRRRTRAAR